MTENATLYDRAQSVLATVNDARVSIAAIAGCVARDWPPADDPNRDEAYGMILGVALIATMTEPLIDELDSVMHSWKEGASPNTKERARSRVGRQGVMSRCARHRGRVA